MNEPRPPTAEEQLDFLRSLQRLLDEGSFVASYKFALLNAIADLCILKGDDSGGELELHTSELAEQFVRLYWRQAAPFVSRDSEKVLKQNTGRQAAVVRHVARHHDRYGGSLAELRKSPSDWSDLRRKVERTVKVMPLWKLQTVGSERLEFLYENSDAGAVVRLKPGVAYCFRAFHPMITDMLQGAWLGFVQRCNPRLLGQVVDLRSFLFGAHRSSLARFASLLRDVQEGGCFYCGRAVRSGGAVDHFIPWRRYPLDLGHNYVLAHKGCNSSKSDRLAAEEHLDRWAERSHARRDELEEGFRERSVLTDWPATRQVAHWAYGQVHKAGGQVWVQAKELRPLSDDWARILSAASPPAA